MTEWWNSIPLAEQIFFFLAAPTTLILIIQTILLFFGMGDEGADTDAGGIDGDGIEFDAGDGDGVEFDVDGMRLFTVRGLIAFFCVAGWSGMLFVELAWPLWLCILLSAALGFAALVGIAALARAMLKLQESGNADIRSAIGQTGQVYLTIPAANGGQGKVNVVVSEALRELSAVTQDGKSIPTGATVRIVDVNSDVLTVERE